MRSLYLPITTALVNWSHLVIRQGKQAEGLKP